MRILKALGRVERPKGVAVVSVNLGVTIAKASEYIRVMEMYGSLRVENNFVEVIR
ncbi:MAG: hypothetical protein HYS81_04860 [Candidatus Aenigmatarchaeota archaeon]|nr:MAG: hypothetical protein HYS81_04860 [Candidatus Aenigmarchaeota archaeon]